ncbi:MAG: iron-containing alcohol dehydrogenase family protein [Synechococcales cyanobacterium T60_A2020_003]|nr:iron-containing alcohol dehydrogenase family protein [Synechococcales cyanobacterium T60_A2020_003]
MTYASPSPNVALPSLAIAPAQVLRGAGMLGQAGGAIAALGTRPLVVGGDRTLDVIRPVLAESLDAYGGAIAEASYGADCSEAALATLRAAVEQHQADVILGVGGGKALDAAKLLAYQCNLPIVTIPTSAATCAAWTALSNIYSEDGAFQYDVGLARCPDLLILDYDLVQTAPQRTLVAGIGDAIAKWYEASVSSGHSSRTLLVAAVQQARVLRDLLFQKSVEALANPGGEVWQDVVDASVLLAGVIGGIGGAQCRTVAAHAVHNGLTHLPQCHDILHGEKVAFGILVQLRLEELVQGNRLAETARQQLLTFYGQIGLPTTLEAMGLDRLTVAELHHAATVACAEQSDIHRLPFAVSPEHVVAAMVSTTVMSQSGRSDEAIAPLENQESNGQEV